MLLDLWPLFLDLADDPAFSRPARKPRLRRMVARPRLTYTVAVDAVLFPGHRRRAETEAALIGLL